MAYTRDSAGQITTVTTTQPGHGATNLATSVTHMPFGPVASLTWGNAVTDARTFDLDYRMTSVKDVGTGNIQYLSYGYDADNNVHTVTDNVTPANNQTLTWDVIDRLTGATGSYTAESIAYDSSSNRKTLHRHEHRPVCEHRPDEKMGIVRRHLRLGGQHDRLQHTGVHLQQGEPDGDRQPVRHQHRLHL